MSIRRRGRHRRRLILAVLVFVLAVGFVVPAPVQAVPLTFTVQATNGEGNSRTPGRPCGDGGDGAYWHYDYGSALAGGIFSSLAGEVRVHLDLHSDLARFPNTAGAYPAPGGGPTAFLLGGESHASLLNDRGSLKLRLTSGSCATPTLAFDGSTASGPGQWAVHAGAGAYRQAAGTGTFTLTQAEVNPGADNRLQMSFSGGVDVLQPSLKVEVLGSYWGQLGADYVSRRPTVVYRITNTGPGDSFGARLVDAQPATNGVRVLGPRQLALGDLSSGESIQVEIRWQLGTTAPCALVILGCRFDTTLTVDLPDALDVRHVSSKTVAAKAPLSPPPL